MPDLHVIPTVNDPINNVRDAARALAEARVEFATQFLRNQTVWKGPKPLTDRQAQEMTIAATNDAVTLAEAELTIALHVLRSDSANQPHS